MGSLKDVQAFVRDVRTAPSLTDIGLILKDATRSFQFDHFALAQRLTGPVTAMNVPLGPVRLTDFPDAWVDQLVGQGRIADDPVLLACERSVAPFAWSSLETLLPMNDRHRAYMALNRAGFAGGCLV